MKKTTGKQVKDRGWASYYDDHGVLGELIEEDVTLSLGEELRAAALRSRSHAAGLYPGGTGL